MRRGDDGLSFIYQSPALRIYSHDFTALIEFARIGATFKQIAPMA